MAREGEKRFWLLTVMLAAYGLAYFHRVMSGVMKYEIVTLADYYSVDPRFLLSIFPSAYFYAYASAQLFVGPMVDRYGVKRIGALMIGLMGLSAIIMALPSAITLIAGRFLVGATAAVAFLSSQRVASRSFSAFSQATVTALLLAVGNISSLLATYPLRLFLSAYGIVPLLLLLAGLSFTIAFSTFSLSKDMGSSGRSVKVKSTFREMLVIIKSKHVLASTMGCITTGGTGLAFHAAWGQDLMSTFFGMSNEEVSLYLMLLCVVLIASNVASGLLSDRVLHERKPLLVASTASSAIGWALICTSCPAKAVGIFAVGLVVLGVAMGLSVVSVPMVKEPFGQDYAATATAVFNLMFFSSTAVLQSVEPFIGPWIEALLSLALSILGALVVRMYAIETLKPSSG